MMASLYKENVQNLIASDFDLDLNIKGSAIKSLNFPSGFTLSRHFSRFLSGDGCLRELRRVSRRRLYLANSGSLSNDDESIQLNSAIKSYGKSVEFLTNSPKITKPSLCKVNKWLTPEKKKAGAIRDRKVRVGSSMCVHPDRVHGLINNLLQFIGQDSVDPIHKATAIYLQMNLIHPFVDGNGRTSRVLFESLLKRNNIDIINPILSNLSIRDQHKEALKNFLSEKNNKRQIKNYWAEAFQWSIETSTKVSNMLNKADLELTSYLTKDTDIFCFEKFKEKLWHNPIINKISLSDKEQELGEFLVGTGLLKKKRSRSNMQGEIYECEIISRALINIDELAFQKSA